ncbi:MAG: Hpt domain-containing protein [Roseovarius sp.]|nr:Hpt domain-containing protein [Roseovarius sp.]
MIDWNRVSELRDEIGAEDFAEVAAAFLEETDNGVAVLDGVPDNRLSPHLHALKGSALNLGFAEFAGLCQAGETAARATNPVDRGAIAVCYAASRSAFLVALPGLCAS